MFVVALFAGLSKTLILAEEASDFSRCVTQLVADPAGATQHVIDLPGDRAWQLLFQKARHGCYGRACLLLEIPVFSVMRLISSSISVFLSVWNRYTTDFTTGE